MPSSSPFKPERFITHVSVRDLDNDPVSAKAMTSMLVATRDNGSSRRRSSSANSRLTRPSSPKESIESMPPTSSHSVSSISSSILSAPATPKSSRRGSATRPTTPRNAATPSSAGPEDSPKKYRFDAAPKLVRTPWEADRKNVFTRQFVASEKDPVRENPKILPAKVFKTLPGEIYDSILRQVEGAHWREEGTCVGCYLGDLVSLASVSRAWSQRVRGRIYQKVWFSVDSENFGRFLVRVKKLRRTLRESPVLGAMVKEITVLGAQELYRNVPKEDKDTILSGLASIVMACPNLERLKGFNVEFDHDYDRFTHALSTRTKLKEKVWVLRGIEESWDHKGNFITNQLPIYSDGSIANGDVFLSSHSRWRNLDTLFLFGNVHGNLDYRAFVGTFRSLPSLKHLIVSNFSAIQFNDRTLAAIPPGLHSLRLQDLAGLTERGMTRFSQSYCVDELRSLALINTPLNQAQILSSILAAAKHLTSLSVVQAAAPAIDPSHPAAARPLYVSASLSHLHWDISPLTAPSLAHWAVSIRNGALPGLRWIRSPCDDGTLQALCRPKARVSHPDDAVRVAAQATVVSLRNSLASARLAAQERLEKARLEPLMAVVVTDETGVVLSNYFIRGFLGKVESLIDYVLDGEIMEAEDFMSGRSMLKPGSICEGVMPEKEKLSPKGGSLVKIRAHPGKTRMKVVNNMAFFR